MKKLSEIISEDMFANAFRICQEYCRSDEHILDVNFRLLKSAFLMTKESQVRHFYNKYIATDLIYALPELFSSDIVTIPKKLTGIREYRFLSFYSMITYNAVGLLFIECCSDFIKNINFTRRNIYAYYPTKFNIDEKNNWETKNDYKDEYRKFGHKLQENLQLNDIVLRFDIEKYFESIPHATLIELIRMYSPESSLKAHCYDSDSHSILEFYFKALMSRNYSIPQGRKNFISDYLGYLYLVPFDIKVTQLCKSGILNFKCAIRYVDDVFIIFTNANGVDRSSVLKELMNIEQNIASWLHSNLELTISPNKTQRHIVSNMKERNIFIKRAKKTISSVDDNSDDSMMIKDDISTAYKRFKEILTKFKYSHKDSFLFEIKKDEVEDLKIIFDYRFKSYLLTPKIKRDLIHTLREIDIELLPDHIYILITIFFITRHGDMPFVDVFLSYVKKITRLDKRHIHVLLASLAQDIDKKSIKKVVCKFKDQLLLDNYGKYLLAFFKLCRKEKNANPVFKRICKEYEGKKHRRSFLFEITDDYAFLIEYIIANYRENGSIIRQLKYFIVSKTDRDWDRAFNHFHSMFHELCKVKFKLNDHATVQNVLKKVTNLGIENELLVMKFYDRRNFNLVTHPSRKGIPSVKVSKSDVDFYVAKILSIIRQYF